MELVIKDPKWVKPERYSVLERAFLPLMRDERDLIFINVSAVMTVTVLPMARLPRAVIPRRLGAHTNRRQHAARSHMFTVQ